MLFSETGPVGKSGTNTETSCTKKGEIITCYENWILQLRNHWSGQYDIIDIIQCIKEAVL